MNEELNAALECVTFDETSGSWTTEGVSRLVSAAIDSAADTVICETSHLSMFAVRKASPSNSFSANDAIFASKLESMLPVKTKSVTSVNPAKYGSKDV